MDLVQRKNVRRWVWTALGVSILMLGSGCGPTEAPVDPADLVLVNGRLVTVDKDLPEAEALAIRDSRIVAVGTGEEINAYIGEGTDILDLAGKLAIPGFIEGHGHFTGLGDFKSQLDLRSAQSWDDIVSQVASAAAEAEPGAWIRGRGWHQDKWTAAPEPNLEGFPLHTGLSAVSPKNPVVLTHASGHAVFVNARAMELAGIDDLTPDPAGGEILHDASGQPTGLLRETAEALIEEILVESSAEKLRRVIDLASKECLSKGVTSFHDAGSSLEVVDALNEAAQDGTLGVRLWVMIRDSNKRLAENLAAYKSQGDMISVSGIKVSIDGALGSRGAWLLEPYTDSPESTGLNLATLESARETAELAMQHGYQLAIHAIGDRANREILDLYAQTFADHPDKTGLRWRIEHAQHLHPNDLSRFAELDVIASMQAVHCTSDGPWVPDRLGDQRSEEGAYMWRTLLDSGAVVINGTDAPVEDVDPIANFYSTVTRQMVNGETFYPDQRMTREEALESYTLTAAYAAFEEDLKGSLTVGKLADIVVLSKDIMTVPEEEIPQTEVIHTILGGKVVYSK